MICKDVFDRGVNVGDYVVAATLSYKSAHIRIGKVSSIGPKGNPTIQYAIKYGDKIVLGHTTSFGLFVLIMKESLPTSVVTALELTKYND